MRLPDDYDDRQKLTPTVVSSILIVTLFVAAILVIVLLVNRQDNQTPKKQNVEASVPTQESVSNEQKYPDTEDLLSGSKLTPDDLDFWDKYPEKTEEATPPPESEEEPVPENDPSTDGKHTLVKYADGKEEWVLISPYLPKHEYDFTKLVCQSNLMKYYVDGKQVSFVGVNISKFQDYVDFVKLKKAGIDYVMLRVGFRGYSSGQIVLDDYFLDNIKRANDAGLEVGVYFFSQAITKEEAVEEANMVLQNISEYDVTFPVAFYMESVDNDSARIDALSKAERTTIAKAFLDTIKDAGYNATIFGDKEWLIKQIDMSKLTAYDIWLSQIADVPDYPYKFSMWHYGNAIVDGVAGYADLSISFIDYSEK